MKYLVIILLLSISFVQCCDKEPIIYEPLNENECIRTFSEINDLHLISKNDSECIFYTVYKFKGTYYFELVCCVCDLIPNIVDCSGNLYAMMGTDKYADFKKSAIVSDSILIHN